MLQIINELRELRVSRWELVRILLLTILFALFEGMGIGMLIPTLRYIEEGFEVPSDSAMGLLFTARDALNISEGGATVIFLLSVAFLALLIRSTAHYFREVDAARLKLRTGRRLRTQGVQSFFRASLPFLNRVESGRIYATLTMEVDRAAEALAARIVFITVLLLCLSYTTLLFVLSPALTLLSLPAFCLIGLAFRQQSRITKRYGKAVSKSNHLFSKLLSDQLKGMTHIKMRAREEEAIEHTNRTVRDLYQNLFSIEKTRVLVDIGAFPVLVLMAFVVLTMAVLYLDMALASLGIFMFVLVRLAPQVSLLNGLWTHIHGCMESYRELRKSLREAVSQLELDAGHLAFERLYEAITFDSVEFHYPDSKEAFELKEISFEVPRGSLTALVGRSGSGKSTLIRLLTRFYRPVGGEILLDDVPIDQFSLDTLRCRMALVPQEPYLFDTTLRRNLLFGVPGPHTEQEIWELLKMTKCAGFVGRMSRGLDTPVGPGGNRLSQGQRQRIAIAHALLSSPEILILDEPTSALDSESEKAIQNLLRRYHGELTILVIAHRLATIRHADQILVLEGGRIAGSAPHEILAETSAAYQRLFENQLIG